MREYPKMLYVGTAQSYKHKSARNEQHEAELRELGFVDFTDLEDGGSQPEEYMKDKSTGQPMTVPQHVYDQVFTDRKTLEAENVELKRKWEALDKLNNGVLSDLAKEQQAHLELANAAKDAELRHAEFYNNVKAMKDRIAELQGDTDPVGTSNDSIDYSKKTAKELRALLDEKGIKYLQRDDLDTLRALLTQPEKTEE